jgi:hypothetical protein
MRTHVLAASLLATVVVALPAPVFAQYVEVLASSNVIGDVEFDWGRDGVVCSACNFGVGNSQFNWTDRNNNLWVGTVNPQTGAFNTTTTAQMQLVSSTAAFFWEDWGNGPEWAFSTPPGAPGGNPISQLVYTGCAQDNCTSPYAGAAFATRTSATAWSTQFLPGAIGPYTGTGSQNMILPEASQCNSMSTALVLFSNIAVPQQMFTEAVSNAVGTVPALTPFGPFANGIGERWVPCTTALTFQGNATYTAGNGTQTVIQQVYWYNSATPTQPAVQITTDPTAKQRATMFTAPDFGHIMILMAAAAGSEIQVYEQTGTGTNGAPTFTLVNTIVSPEPAEPYIFDPKAFIHCNPTCETYVVYGITAVSGSQTGISTPNGLALAKLNPATPMNTLIVSGVTGYPYQRLDPKYFITQQGPFVYYDRIVPLTSKTLYNNEGVYYINLLLGPPSGPCVGSGAEGGLQSGC